MTPDTPLAAENGKLITLARAALGRGNVASAAAIRDETGRTYVAGAVDLPQLTLTALEAAAVVAAAAGATGIEAAALVTGRSDVAASEAQGERPAGTISLDSRAQAVLASLALPGFVLIECDRAGRVTSLTSAADLAGKDS